jgi:colanic acid/amylovoran biosynthesis protein
VRLGEPRFEERDGRVERSVRVAWAGGEFRLWVTVPAELAGDPADLSPFVCTTLLLAMRRAEELEVDGPVAPALLERLPRIVDLYARWDPRLYRSRVDAEPGQPPPARAPGIGSFFSRGVDSLYSACSPRALPGPLTHLVFCDRLEPLHSPVVRAEEVRLAREAAAAVGLPLVVMESNVRELTDPVVRDWEDMAGAGLAFLANALAGGLGHVVIPSSDGPQSIGPNGTSPLLDPLFSSGAVEVEHDEPRTRAAKVAWLARERPDLLPWLKVCFNENRPDNCGRCGKCLLTMLALEGAGARERATGFPGEFDLDALNEISPTQLNARLDFEEVRDAVAAAGAAPELVAACDGIVERARLADPAAAPLRTDSPGFRRRASAEAFLTGRRGATVARRPERAARPRTSVLMAAYNAEATLRESVASVLAQSVGELELVVVDDGSRVPVAEVLDDLRADPRLRIVRHARNRGLSAARNTALAAARAPLVSQLDADDLWEPDYLESILPCFDDPAVGLAYSNALILGHPGGHTDYIGDPSVHPMYEFPKIAEQCPVPCPTATMRTAAVRGVGGYARWLRQCEDYHLYMKLAHAGWEFAYVHRQLARYRWPQPDRGMSFDPRPHELWELGMFAGFVAAHPRTPGPRRQVRTRVARELRQAREVARRRLPRAEAGSGPRIFVEPGSHDVLNLGDIAMLQVCVERLRAALPGASIGVITSAPERLTGHVPGVEPIPAAGMYEWLDRPWAGGAYAPLVPAALGRAARRVGGAAALRAEQVAREPLSDEVRGFLAWLTSADAVVVSGRGGLSDAFRQDGLRMLALLRTAAGLGARTALLGQGIGPGVDSELRARMAEVLPRLDLVAVRERVMAPGLLGSLGVEPERLRLTGDDVLELAHRMRPAAAAESGIGVSLRMSAYAGVSQTAALTLGDVLAGAAERHASGLTAVPVSLYPHESDGGTLVRLLDVNGGPVDDPATAIERAGSCRVVVAGSYHAAVFALAQGVPAVGLVASAYYRAKFEGLADLFPGGCTVVELGEPGFGDAVSAAIDDLWGRADELRPRLLEAAERQIAESRAAYGRLAELLGGDGQPRLDVRDRPAMTARAATIVNARTAGPNR